MVRPCPRVTSEIVQEQEIIQFLARQGTRVGLIHRHAFARKKSFVVELLYLSCGYVGSPPTLPHLLWTPAIIIHCFCNNHALHCFLHLPCPVFITTGARYPLSFVRLLPLLQMMVYMEKKFVPTVRGSTKKFTPHKFSFKCQFLSCFMFLYII
jgi:hypothetical protein